MVVIIHSRNKKVKLNVLKFLFTFTVLISLIIGMVSVIDGSGTAMSANEHNEIVIVRPGDSLWSIAGEIAQGNHSTRDIVNDIVKLNALDDVTLYVGQQLEVPAEYFIPVQ